MSNRGHRETEARLTVDETDAIDGLRELLSPFQEDLWSAPPPAVFFTPSSSFHHPSAVSSSVLLSSSSSSSSSCSTKPDTTLDTKPTLTFVDGPRHHHSSTSLPQAARLILDDHEAASSFDVGATVQHLRPNVLFEPGKMFAKSDRSSARRAYDVCHVLEQVGIVRRVKEEKRKGYVWLAAD